MSFDQATLELLDKSLEVEIETARVDGSMRRTIIWIVVDHGEVFVRSVRGDRGHWFQAALSGDEPIHLEVGNQRIPVSAQPADDADSIRHCSRALELKYAGDPALQSMLRPMVLSTTLRLQPA